MSNHNESRRKFIKKAAYVAPIVLTLNATPAIATYGSNQKGSDGPGSHHKRNKRHKRRRYSRYSHNSHR